MTQDYIPSVLLDNRGSISTERALKQVLELLEILNCQAQDTLHDKIVASIDGIETMIKKVR